MIWIMKIMHLENLYVHSMILVIGTNLKCG